jgi:hypothetical protein
VCEQISRDERVKRCWIFNYVIRHLVAAPSAKAYFRDLDMHDNACKHDLVAPPAAGGARPQGVHRKEASPNRAVAMPA